PTRTARATPSEEVDCDQVTDGGGAGEAVDLAADLNHAPRGFVAGSNGVHLLLTDEEASFHRAESARADLDDDVPGARLGARLVAEFDGAGSGDDCDLHGIS